MARQHKANPTLSEFNEDIGDALKDKEFSEKLHAILSTLKAVNMNKASQNNLITGYTLAIKGNERIRRG